MARLYSEQLYIAHNINTGSFTVPDDQVWVIRWLGSFAAAPVAGGAIQLIDHDTEATFWYGAYSPSFAEVWLEDPDIRIVRPAGSTTDIVANAGLGEGVDLLLCGYALTLP